MDKKKEKDFAIVKIGGTQYKVSVGDKIRIPKVSKKPKEDIVYDEVLLINRGGKVKIGNPTIKNEKVEAKVVEHVKGEKIRVFKYKAKSRYRKTKGHRQKYTMIEIIKI